jgi:phosphatidylinositol alpha-1,6-mannosyltransferase
MSSGTTFPDVESSISSNREIRRNRRAFLGAAALEPGQGGISRVARLTARTLIDCCVELEMVALHDRRSANVVDHKAAGLRGSKLAFVARTYSAALRDCFFIYDSIGIARAHPRAFGLQRPYAVWMHGVEVWESLRPERKRILQNASLSVVNSQYTRDRYLELHPDGPVPAICWLATEEDDPPASRKDKSGPPTVLILGRIDETEKYKGHAELIASWPAVVASIPDARLLIVGTGSGLANIARAAEASPAARNIEIAGFVEEAALTSIWSRAHLFAMPSRGEGFGLVYVEAMRHGLPIIASAHDAGPELNLHGVTGYNVNLDHKDELPGRIVELLTDETLMSAMGANATERWSRHFRYSNFRARLGEILADFVGGSTLYG